MKICILGAGVIGVSTAFALARQGHDLIVIDKGSDVAEGASHANGAQLSYSYVDPFAGPDIVKKLPAYLLGTDPAIQLGVSFKPDYLKWGVSFLRNCTKSQFAKNQHARRTLARQSQEAMTSFECDLPQNTLCRTGHGKLVLAQTQAEADRMLAREKSGAFLEHNQTYLTPSKCLEIEPSLQEWKGPLRGGTYAPNDNALNPVTYCRVLKKACQDRFGVKFYFNETAQKIQPTQNSKFVVLTKTKEIECDKLIICLGNYPNPILKPLGISVPIYPMQGYSVTVPVSRQSPKTSITDLKNKTVFANLGTHIRIAGFLDANQNPKNTQKRSQKLLNIAQNIWPNAANYNGPIQHWTHYRPMTPSGVPIIGETKIPGLYLNVGHGSLGYTFAAGSAMKLANSIGHIQKNSSKFGGNENAFH